MGCTQSKIENEQAVSRCKERKQFMKQAVSSRNAFAAAHSSYAIFLKNTGAALSDYAHSELSHHPSSSPISSSPAGPSSSVVNLPPPPPPLPNFQNPPPLQRAASMPDMKIQKPESRPVGPTTIIEEEEELDFEAHDNEKLTRKRSSGASSSSRGEVGPQPPPPRQQQQWKEQEVVMRAPMNQGSTWGDYIFATMESMPGPGLAEEEELVQRVSRVSRMEVGPTPPLVVVEEEGKVERAVEVPVPMPIPMPMEKKAVKKGSGSVAGGEVGRRVGKPLNLMQIFAELDDHFLKASESAQEVSKMLEATRLHYHSNFADNRGNIFKITGFFT